VSDALRRPNFFIVGAAKSGTTSMLRYLAQHADISMPQRREPIYFGRDLGSHSKRVTDLGEYLSMFSECCNERIVGEKSVWYLYSESAAEEIREFDPSSKIMIMLRNPVDMIYSLHQQFVSTGNEDVTSFDTALALVDERAAGRHIPDRAYFPGGLAYTRVPQYSEQVARYLGAFGNEQVHIIRFEDLAFKTESTYAQALEFLGVSRDFMPEFAIYNKKMKPRSRWIDQLVRNPPSLVPRRLCESLVWRLARFNRIESVRPPLSPELRTHLKKMFRPDVERLSELLSRDFTDWCKI
jgi:hypothetical protein